MRATTAVILARGLGTRMRAGHDGSGERGHPGTPLSPAQAEAATAGRKGLMPVGDHPLLDHVLHELAEGGVTDVVFVVAPGDAAIRERYARDAPPKRLKVHFAEQQEPRGTADALLAAFKTLQEIAIADAQRVRGRQADAPWQFLMLNADNLYLASSVAALVALHGPGLIAYDADALVSLGNIPAERVLKFALLEIMPDDTLAAIVEKPPAGHPLATARERWVSMNLWRFESSIFADCAGVRLSPRGELELSDAVRGAIARGVRFHAIRQRAAVLDLSSRGDVAVVTAALAGRVPQP
jgi:dTDP-glucose pyrophosphorylase